jgi:hypothetical protein
MDLQSLSENNEPEEGEEDLLAQLEGPGSPEHARDTALLLRVLGIARLTVVASAAAAVLTVLGTRPVLHTGLAVLTGTMLLAVGLLLHLLRRRLPPARGAPVGRAMVFLVIAGGLAVGLPWVVLAMPWNAMLTDWPHGAVGVLLLVAVPWVFGQTRLARAFDGIAAEHDPTFERGISDVVVWSCVAAGVWFPVALAVAVATEAWVGAVLAPLPLWLAHVMGTVQVWQAAILLENSARNLAAPPEAPPDGPGEEAGPPPRAPHWPASVESDPHDPPL